MLILDTVLVLVCIALLCFPSAAYLQAILLKPNKIFESAVLI